MQFVILPVLYSAHTFHGLRNSVMGQHEHTKPAYFPHKLAAFTNGTAMSQVSNNTADQVFQSTIAKQAHSILERSIL